MVEIRLVGKYDEVLVAKEKLERLFPPVSDSAIARNENGKGYKSYINVVVPSSFENLGMYDKKVYGLYDLTTGISIDERDSIRGMSADDYDRNYTAIVGDDDYEEEDDYKIEFADFEDVDGV